LGIAGLANIKWEGVPGFGGCYPEGWLAELKSRSRQNIGLCLTHVCGSSRPYYLCIITLVWGVGGMRSGN